jgi:hypothetical protein
LATTLYPSNISQLTPVTAVALFPMAPNNVARDKFRSLLTSLKDSILKRASTSKKPDQDVEDVAKLQELVDALRSELGTSIFFGNMATD